MAYRAKDQMRLPVTCVYERVVAQETRMDWRMASLGALYDGDDGGGGNVSLEPLKYLPSV
ncbi:hypothetical protein BGAL_0067g00050 [Botrytis galanthina]|uniref:Uncharacterized protein n=1 Tax=Botrytis galanthina TaxID=278940 RepID=A0A4S8R8Z5_9HELO|nr:hypothetical protein BGAL_0067g00050 [Botrytis galanthina]